MYLRHWHVPQEPPLSRCPAQNAVLAQVHQAPQSREIQALELVDLGGADVIGMVRPPYATALRSEQVILSTFNER